MFRLRFPEDDILSWAARYTYPGEADIESRVAPAARARRFLTRDEFSGDLPVENAAFSAEMLAESQRLY